MSENKLLSDFLAGRIKLSDIYDQIDILEGTENIFFAHVAGDACISRDPKKAEWFYKRSLDYGSRKWFTFFNLQQAMLRQGDFAQALEILQGLKQNPDWYKGKPSNYHELENYFYGLCLFGLGEKVSAADYISNAIRAFPELAFEHSAQFALSSFLGKFNSFYVTMQERLNIHCRASREATEFYDTFALVDKNNGRVFIESKTPEIRLPKQFYKGKDYQELGYSLSGLNGNFVIKPSNSADSDCVLLFKEWREVFTGEMVDTENLPNYVQRRFESGRFLNSRTQILAEEYIKDFETDNIVPLDYKTWCFNGLCVFVQIISRNGSKCDWSSCFYGRDGSIVEDPIQCSYKHVKKQLPSDSTFKEYWSDLIKQSELISRYLKHFMRIDFYLSESGPVFGEFTTYPFAGKRYSDLGSKVLNNLFFLLANQMNEIN